MSSGIVENDIECTINNPVRVELLPVNLYRNAYSVVVKTQSIKLQYQNPQRDKPYRVLYN